MKELYLFLVASSGQDGIFFIFCKEYEALTLPPRKTGLQKAMLSVLESGEKLRSGGMFFLKEDLEAFDQQFYRKEEA